MNYLTANPIPPRECAVSPVGAGQGGSSSRDRRLLPKPTDKALSTHDTRTLSLSERTGGQATL